MALIGTVGTQEIHEMLAERGLRAHRERIAETSDMLGLRTRNVEANWCPRRWRPAEAELIVLAIELKQQWNLRNDAIRALLTDGGDSIGPLLERFGACLWAFAEKAPEVTSDAERWEATPAPSAAAASSAA